MFRKTRKNWNDYKHEQEAKNSWTEYHNQVAKAEEILRKRFSNTRLNDSILNTCAIIYVDTDNNNDTGAWDLYDVNLAYDYPIAKFVMMRAAKRFGWKREVEILQNIHSSNGNEDILI